MGGSGPRTHRCLRTLLYLLGLRGKDAIDEGPVSAFLSRAGSHRIRGSSYTRTHHMNRSKYDKDSRRSVSRSDSVDPTVDTRPSDGMPTRDAHYGRVTS